MEAKDLEWKLLEEHLKERRKKVFADSFHTPHDFPLSDFINEVDVIHALLLVLIPLMHGIHANIARFSVWFRFSPFTNRNRRRIGFCEGPHMGNVLSRLSEVVQMAHGNVFEAEKSFIMEYLKLPTKDFFRRLA